MQENWGVINPSPRSPDQVRPGRHQGVVSLLQGRVGGTRAQLTSFSPEVECAPRGGRLRVTHSPEAVSMIGSPLL